MRNKSNFPYYLGVFLISPVLASISAIANFKQYSAKRILVLFFGAYGYTLIITPGKDSHSLSETFKNYIQDLSLTEFVNEIVLIMTLSGSREDEPYMTVLSYVVAQFTSNPSWLFMLVGMIYGFFYIKGITLIHSETNSRWNSSLVILFLFFISWVSINGINAPRNWTGAWIFFCGTLLYLKTQDLKFAFFVLLAPLCHFAYSLITVPFFIYLLFKDLKKVYIAILIASFVVSASTSFVKPYLSTTELGEDKIEDYIENPRWQEGGRDVRPQDHLNYHARYYRVASDVAIQFMFITSILFLGYFTGKNHDRLQTGLASISILMLSLSNLFSTIPVLSNRLFVNFGNFALAYLILLFSRNYEDLKSYHWTVDISIPAILLFLFTQYSQFGEYIDFRVLFSPLLYPFLGDDPVSMKAFIRQLLEL